MTDLGNFRKHVQNHTKYVEMGSDKKNLEKNHIPIGSMYGIYTNIWGILMVNVTIYGIHGSYGIGKTIWKMTILPNSGIFPAIWRVPIQPFGQPKFIQVSGDDEPMIPRLRKPPSSKSTNRLEIPWNSPKIPFYLKLCVYIYIYIYHHSSLTTENVTIESCVHAPFRCFLGTSLSWHASMITFNVSLRQCGRKASPAEALWRPIFWPPFKTCKKHRHMVI